MQVDTADKNLMTKEEIEDKIATFTGGRAAEEVAFGEITTGASNGLNNYQYAIDLNPESPAQHAYQMAMDILNFYNKDMYNQ